MAREEGSWLLQDRLRRMVERNGSGLFITAGCAPAIRVDDLHNRAQSLIKVSECDGDVGSGHNDSLYLDPVDLSCPSGWCMCS